VKVVDRDLAIADTLDPWLTVGTLHHAK